MMNKVEDVFVADLLELSPRANEYADIVWMVYKMSSPVPLKFVTFHLSEYEPTQVMNKIKILTEANLISWFARGIEPTTDDLMKNEETQIFLMLGKDFNSLILEKGSLTRDNFRRLVYDFAGGKLVFYCKNKLTDFVLSLLSFVIYHATPEKPIFIGKLVREISSIWRVSQKECKEILSYYLDKFLELVKIENGILVNLSTRGIEKLRKDEELFNIYSERYKPEKFKIEKTSPPISESDFGKLKELKKHFSWISLSR